MFNFKSFNCEFVLSRNQWNNISISLHADNGVFLYQLTEDVSFPLAEGVVLLKKAPFIYQFLAQMQNDGILIDKPTLCTIGDREFLLGAFKERRCAAVL